MAIAIFDRDGGKSRGNTEKRDKLKRRSAFFVIVMILILMTPVLCFAGVEVKTSGPVDSLVLSGIITNAQGKGVKEASMTFFLNEERIEPEKEVSTSRDGTFEAEFRLPAGCLVGATLSLEVSKPSYKSSGQVVVTEVVQGKSDEKGGTHYLAHQNLILERSISPAFWIATLILAAVYGLIAFEVVHRALAALLGAASTLFVTYTLGSFDENYVILTFEDAVHAIDLNVIFLLMAMMMIVGVIKRTGVFQWLAFRAYQVARGNVFVLSSILMLITAITSSFLDNVTTMILIIPVTVEIASVLKINPITLLLPEVFASNVGGTATLIGDPPNIMIGSYAKLTFLNFISNLALICLICLVVSVVYFLYWYKKDYVKAQVGEVQDVIDELRATYKITDRRLLIQCAVVLGITIFLFIIHGALHMEPSIAAMTGAAALLVISRVNMVETLVHEIEWPTLIFFMMLFMIVAGAEETGLIQVIADWVNHISRGSLVVAILVILWVSALASSIIDNIPFTATMLPILAYLNDVVPGAQGGILWWALALGACLGGNGTMIGASANVVTVGIAETRGYHISFVQYFKIAFVPMTITIILASFWLLVVAM